MAKKSVAAAKPARRSSRAQFWLLTLLFLSALIAMPIYHAKQLAGWAVNHLYGPDASFESSMPLPNSGGIQFANVSINTEGAPIRISEIKMDMPITWFLASAYTLGAFKPDLRYAKISYLNVQNPDGLSLANIHPLIGSRTAALGESFGCDDLNRITDTHFTAMGLSPGASNVITRFDLNRGELTQSDTLENQGVGMAEVVKVGASREVAQELFSRPGLPNDLMVKSLSFRLTDQGFIGARNNFCAGKVGGNTAQYLAWNLASLERLAASEGIRISAKLRAMYQDYATHGGEITANVGFSKEMTTNEFVSTAPADLIEHIGGDVRRGGLFVILELFKQDKIELPNAVVGMTIYQQLQKEGLLVEPLTLSKPDSLKLLIDNALDANTMVVKATVSKRLSSEVYLLPAFETAELLSFSQISGQVGRRVRIERRGRGTMTAQVLGAGTAGGVRLRIQQNSGFIEMELSSEGFVRAFLLPRRSE
jgi:hypothetical protein